MDDTCHPSSVISMPMHPGTITALRTQAQDSQRINVFVDGEFGLGVSLTTLARERLYVGQVLSAEDLERIAHAESIDKAFHAAVRLLEARPRSTSEIRDRLRRKGFDSAAIEGALQRLTELGMIDDAAFTRHWIENRQTFSPRGSNILRDELRRKGIAPDVVAQALNDDTLVGDQATHALAVARAAVRKYASSPDYPTFARRMGGYLQRRGYGYEVIRPIIEQLWSEFGRETAPEDDTDFAID